MVAFNEEVDVCHIRLDTMPMPMPIATSRYPSGYLTISQVGTCMMVTSTLGTLSSFVTL